MSKESYLPKVVQRKSAETYFVDIGSAETYVLKNDVLYIGAVVFDMLTAIYCNFGNFGSGFLTRSLPYIVIMGILAVVFSTRSLPYIVILGILAVVF